MAHRDRIIATAIPGRKAHGGSSENRKTERTARDAESTDRGERPRGDGLRHHMTHRSGMTEDRDQIHALIAQYLDAYEARDAAGCVALYTEDACILSPWGPPVRGQKAIAGAHLEWFEEGETNKVMQIADLRIDAALAICLVRYAADIPAEDGPTRVFGASLNALCRQPGGGWKISHTSLSELADGDVWD